MLDHSDVDFEWLDDLDPIDPAAPAKRHFLVINKLRAIRKSKRIAGVLVPVEEIRPILVSGPIRLLDAFFETYLQKLSTPFKYEFFELMQSLYPGLSFQEWTAWIPQSAEGKINYARTTIIGQALSSGWMKLPAWEAALESFSIDEQADSRRSKTFMLVQIPTSLVVPAGSADSTRVATVARLVGPKSDLELLATLDTTTFRLFLLHGNAALKDRDPVFQEAGSRVGAPAYYRRPAEQGGVSQAITDALQEAGNAGYAVNHVAIAARALVETREKILSKAQTPEERSRLRAKWASEEARTLIRSGVISGRKTGKGRGPDKVPRKRRTKAELSGLK